MLSEAFKREVRKFDLERVLPTWDGLIAKQQAVLESQKVPTMSVTTITGDREVCESPFKSIQPVIDDQYNFAFLETATRDTGVGRFIAIRITVCLYVRALSTQFRSVTHQSSCIRLGTHSVQSSLVSPSVIHANYAFKSSSSESWPQFFPRVRMYLLGDSHNNSFCKKCC